MKLSIVTISFNNQADLLNTIRSVLEQTWTDFEYIIIDGGSTDGSIDIIKQYQGQLAYWVSEPDRGVFHAMNKGIEKTSGEYLLMLNAGDILCDANALSRVFANAHHSEDVLFGDVYRAVNGKVFDKSYFPETLTFDFFRHGSLSHQASFVKKVTHTQVGLYDEELRYSSDWKFFVLAICKYNLSYKHLPVFVATCDCGGLTSDAKNFAGMKQEQRRVLEYYFPVFLNDYEAYDAFRNKLLKNQLVKLLPKTKRYIKKLLNRPTRPEE